MKPLLSIVIPVYNAERFLAETLQSVQNQTFKDFECVIVNDGSTDNSQWIIEQFCKEDKRFKSFTIPNSGCADIPIRKGVNIACSDIIVILGHDDILASKMLEKGYIRMQETNSDIIIGQFIGSMYELEGEMYRLPLADFDKSQILSGKEACALTIGGWQISTNGALIRKCLFENVPVGNLMNSDELTSRYVLYNADTVAFSDGVYRYRQYEASISRKVSVKLFDRVLIDRKLCEFCGGGYTIESNVSRKQRNAQFFNLIYLQDMFVSNKWSREEKTKITSMIKVGYDSLNKDLLRRELTLPLRMAFLTSYPLFIIVAPLYARLKRMRGHNYIFK